MKPNSGIISLAQKSVLDNEHDVLFPTNVSGIQVIDSTVFRTYPQCALYYFHVKMPI